MGRVLTICNQKGGVGKTTTAINLAAYLAKAGQRVLLIDTDPQGNATSGLGIDKAQVTQGLYQVLLGELSITHTIMDTIVSQLQLVPSSVDLTGAEVELVNKEGREFLLREVLLPVKEQYDFILVDSPPSLGLLTINALAACDRVLIPVQCEFYALEGLSQLIQTIELVKNSLNPALMIEGLVLTMADYRTNLTHEVIEEARTFVKERIFQSVIPRNVRLSEAPSHGKPILLYDAHSIGAKQYEELAREVLGQMSNIVLKTN